MPKLLSLSFKTREPICCNRRFRVLQLGPSAAKYIKYFQKKRKEEQVTNLIPISMWKNVGSVLFLCWVYLNEGCCFHHETCINNCGLKEGKEYKKKKKFLDEYSSLCSVIYSLTNYFVTFKSPKPC